jgi:hypothetical protein
MPLHISSKSGFFLEEKFTWQFSHLGEKPGFFDSPQKKPRSHRSFRGFLFSADSFSAAV